MKLPFTSQTIPNDWDRRGLPAWTYHSESFFRLEREQVLLNHWQVVGHISDIPTPGDWLSFDLLDERAVIIRGQDGVIRAFMNLCRHRGARVVDGAQGKCRGALVCPFHGWVYNLDGSLRGASRPESFGAGIDKSHFGLKPIELDIFAGFLFIRFRPGPQPKLSTLLSPYAEDFSGWQSEKLLPVEVSGWSTELAVNWKSVRDVDNEGYHVALAHPALQDLYGRDYRDLYLPQGLHVSYGFYGDKPGRSWSVKNYVKHSPLRAELPQHLQKNWAYYGIFPNSVIAFTPESAQFYHDLPLSPGRTHLTGRQYRLPEEDRQTRAARYLAQRIDRDTSAEDQQLSIWSNESMRSEGFEGFHLSDLEWGLRRHHDQIRRLLPVSTTATPPAEHEMRTRNHELLCAVESEA